MAGWWLVKSGLIVHFSLKGRVPSVAINYLLKSNHCFTVWLFNSEMNTGVVLSGLSDWIPKILWANFRLFESIDHFHWLNTNSPELVPVSAGAEPGENVAVFLEIIRDC